MWSCNLWGECCDLREEMKAVKWVGEEELEMIGKR